MNEHKVVIFFDSSFGIQAVPAAQAQYPGAEFILLHRAADTAPVEGVKLVRVSEFEASELVEDGSGMRQRYVIVTDGAKENSYVFRELMRLFARLAKCPDASWEAVSFESGSEESLALKN